MFSTRSKSNWSVNINRVRIDWHWSRHIYHFCESLVYAHRVDTRTKALARYTSSVLRAQASVSNSNGFITAASFLPDGSYIGDPYATFKTLEQMRLMEMLVSQACFYVPTPACLPGHAVPFFVPGLLTSIITRRILSSNIKPQHDLREVFACGRVSASACNRLVAGVHSFRRLL